MVVDLHELRNGGRWQFRHLDPESGEEFLFRGVFHGDPAPDRPVVQTWEYAGFGGDVHLETLTLVPHDGGTLVRTLSVYQSVPARDRMVASGMEGGMSEGYRRLDELVTAPSPA